MLKPRRENRPETRESTPGWFSTSTDSVWCVGSRSPAIRRPPRPRGCRRRPTPASMMSSEPAPAGIIGYTFSSWSTRKSMTRARPLSTRRHDRGVDVLLACRPGSRARRRPRRAPCSRAPSAQVRLREALVVEQLLPLAHHAEPAVVHDATITGMLVDDRGRQLLQRHLEAAVAVDVDHGRVGPAELGADRGREAEAHRAERRRR